MHRALTLLLSVAIFVSSCEPSDSKNAKIDTANTIETTEAVHTGEPRHSTSEEIKYALNESIPSVRNTDVCMELFRQNFNAPLLSSQYQHSLLVQLDICDSEYERIETTHKRHSEADIGKEASECLAIAQLIVGYRAKGLWETNAMLETNNENELRYYKNEAQSSFDEAKRFRAKFKADYGY